ncbi:hypothetical protein B484DRAFT_463490 [Ochromonadaceae sp. CCMP2298]|nr:hypothetical protein B484DRAFT_463490 [Ochromonadaceae sp. CCMP2298]
MSMFEFNNTLRELAEERGKRYRADLALQDSFQAALPSPSDQMRQFISNTQAHQNVEEELRPLRELRPNHAPPPRNEIQEAIDLLRDPNTMEEHANAPIATEVINVDDAASAPRKKRRGGCGNKRPIATAGGQELPRQGGHAGGRASKPPPAANEPSRPRRAQGGQVQACVQACALGNQIFGTPTSPEAKANLAKQGWQKTFVRDGVLVLKAMLPLKATINQVTENTYMFHRLASTKVGKQNEVESVYFTLPKAEIDPILTVIMRGNTNTLVSANVEFAVMCDVHVNGVLITLHLPSKFSNNKRGLIVPINKEKLMQSVIGEPPITAAPPTQVLAPVTAERLIEADDEEDYWEYDGHLF